MVHDFAILLDRGFPYSAKILEIFHGIIIHKLQSGNMEINYSISMYEPGKENNLDKNKFDLFLLNTRDSIRSTGYNIDYLQEKFAKDNAIFLLNQCCDRCDKTYNHANGKNIFSNEYTGLELKYVIINRAIKSFL